MTEIRFARSGDVDVAYRRGGRPRHLVYAEGAYTHLEIERQLPQFRRYCERRAEFTRLIFFISAEWACPIAFPARPRPRTAWTTSVP